jgi:NADH dehydrogenase
MAPPRILVVGCGFAGVECARRLERALAPDEASITLVAPKSYQLYLPLLPQVASGVLTPQSVAVSLRRVLHRTRIAPGGAVGVDPEARVCLIRGLTGRIVNERYDHIVLAPGSVTRTFDIPGLSEQARGMKTLAEAVYLRDHVIAQLDIAAASTDGDDRAARLQFVVVGGGYAGTETAACLQRLTTAAVARYPGLPAELIRWHLIDVAPKLMPELGDDLDRTAIEVLRGRGVDVRLGVSIAEAREDSVTLTDGRVLPCRTLIWTAGVRPSPLVETIGAETDQGRIVVTPELTVPAYDGMFAVGDAAAVPDLAKGGGAVCPQTAQHAQRQGKAVARNLVARLRGQPMRPYRHWDLGLVVDLGGRDAVAEPLGIPTRGLLALGVTRGYHLLAMRTGVAKARVAANWLLNASAGDDFVRTGFLANQPVTLRDLEKTDAYLTRDQVREFAASAAGR